MSLSTTTVTDSSSFHPSPVTRTVSPPKYSDLSVATDALFFLDASSAVDTSESDSVPVPVSVSVSVPVSVSVSDSVPDSFSVSVPVSVSVSDSDSVPASFSVSLSSAPESAGSSSGLGLGLDEDSPLGSSGDEFSVPAAGSCDSVSADSTSVTSEVATEDSSLSEIVCAELIPMPEDPRKSTVTATTIAPCDQNFPANPFLFVGMNIPCSLEIRSKIRIAATVASPCTCDTAPISEAN